MKNGVEYSKSRNYRIVKNNNMYRVERAEYRLTETRWFRTPNGPWDYLANARSEMRKLEEGICPQ